MAIRDFSKISNLSPALISQLERGKGNPSLSALISIAKALDVSLSSLVEEEIQNSELILKSENSCEITTDIKGCKFFDILSKKLSTNSLIMDRIEMEPDSLCPTNIFPNTKKDCVIFVNSGSVDIEFDSEKHSLNSGDTIIVLPERNYKLYNTHNKTSTLIAIQVAGNDK